ncbi:hypothetical protein JCM3770_005718 [Rhodotorula araucariae]
MAGMIGSAIVLFRVTGGTLYREVVLPVDNVPSHLRFNDTDLIHRRGTVSGLLYDGYMHYSAHLDEFSEWAPALAPAHLFVADDALYAQPDVGVFLGKGSSLPWPSAASDADTTTMSTVGATVGATGASDARANESDSALAAVTSKTDQKKDTGKERVGGTNDAGEDVKTRGVPDPVFGYVDIKDWEKNTGLVSEIKKSKTTAGRLQILDRILATLDNGWEPQLPSDTEHYGAIADLPKLSGVVGDDSAGASHYAIPTLPA